MFARYLTSAHEITDAYKEIVLNAKEAKVKIEAASDNSTKVIFFQKKIRPYDCSVQGGALVIKPQKARWYNFVRLGVDRSEIRLCVPQAMLEKISITTNVGRVDISAIGCNGTIDIQANIGKICIENVSCRAFDSKGNTGAVSLHGLTAQESISIKRNTGTVLLNDCSAPQIVVKTNTGKVCGRLPSHMVFTVRTNTGKVQLPKAPIGEAIGGRCDIKTNTGSVVFE